MGEVTLEIVIILLLILANGVFALSEIAIVSARKTRLQRRAEQGDGGAQAALVLADQPTHFLSTVQIGITLIGILSGALGGATLAEEIAAVLIMIPWLAPYGEALGVFVVVIGITFFSLVLGELVPKRIALNDAERIAARVAPSMKTISRIAAPIVHLLSVSTEMVLRALQVKPSQEPSITEDEVKMMIYEGARLGIFEEAEQEIMERVFRLGDRKVSTMMTYRTDVIWLFIEDAIEVNLKRITQSGFARYPVCKGTPDAILGIILVKELFARVQEGQRPELEALLRPALFIPEAMTALQVLERFKTMKEHIAMVVDEFGGIAGVVTMNDVMEAIVGDIPTIEEDEEPEVVRRADGSFLLDGMLSIEELKDILRMEELPEEYKGSYATLGGLFMAQLGRIPATGDFFEWEDLRFEVVDMDGYRVDKVIVTPNYRSDE